MSAPGRARARRKPGEELEMGKHGGCELGIGTAGAMAGREARARSQFTGAHDHYPRFRPRRLGFLELAALSAGGRALARRGR